MVQIYFLCNTFPYIKYLFGQIAIEVFALNGKNIHFLGKHSFRTKEHKRVTSSPQTGY